MTSRASACAWLLALLSGCGAEPVEARAIWVDDFGGAGHRRIHVYDRGEFEQFEVLGVGGPVERVQLDPSGRGVLVRSGERAAAWFDLDDGRRLPLLLPPSQPSSQLGGGQPRYQFADRALTWIDSTEGSLLVVPLAPNLALDRRDDGTIVPLTRAGPLRWLLPAERAPVVLAAGVKGGRASFLRYPTEAEQALAVVVEAEAEGLSLPLSVEQSRRCAELLDCWTLVAVEPEAELAITSSSRDGPWQLFDRRAPALAGPLELPERLAEGAAKQRLRLLKVLDRSVSIWIGDKQIYRYDRAREQVDSLPVVLAPSIHWTAAEQGRALILSSSWGPVYRADLAGLQAINVESTTCANPSDPIVSPNGRWLAWTCTELGPEQVASSGVVVRVSSFGLERHVGVPMVVLAIDDDGDLLLYSVASTTTAIDMDGSSTVPRTLFSLSRDGVLTRIDELEPAPTPVLVGNEQAAYIQAVALERGRR